MAHQRNRLTPLSARKIALIGLLLLPSCGALQLPFGGKDKKEEQAKQPKKESYLDKGPTTGVDLGAGSVTMLEALQIEKKKVQNLQARVRDLEEQLKQCHFRLADAEKKNRETSSNLLSTEATRKALAEKLFDREARILNLSLEKVRLEQELLQMKISLEEKKLAETSSTPAGAGKE
ncbi:MAG TPA: hypothetical protein ENK02_05450 [Planctomycetes bacterium]|nr:hypothetical protein [Planctomycetota bacterium]